MTDNALTVMRAMRPAAALALGLWCALAASPGIAAGLFDDREARKQIAAEKQRIDEIRNDLKAQQAQQTQQQMQQQAIDARIGKVEEALKSQAVLDLFTQLEALKLEMNKLRGQIEVLNNNLENSAKRQRDMYVDLDTRLRRFEQQAASPPTVSTAPPISAPSGPAPPAATTAPITPAAAIDAPAAGTASGAAPAIATAATKPATIAAPGPPAPARTTAESSAESRAYEAAHDQRRIGNYQAAIVAFRGFIKQYPKSNLAPRAQYWIGDSYFNLREFKLAIAGQQAVISDYPDSPTIPDAMLNIASSQIEMGETNAGRKTLEELIARFPISDAADKAKRRLAGFGTPVAAPK